MPKLWQCLEQIPGLVTMPGVWRGWTGEDFEPFRTLCLQTSPKLLRTLPCLTLADCAHEVIQHPSATNPSLLSFTGVCRSEPPICADILLALADITPLQLNWSRLGRAICKAVGCESKVTELGLPNTLQVGSWSADAVPLILTIQTDPYAFLLVIADLVASLNQPFILLAPTADHLDTHAQQLLARVKAAFFPLEAIVVLTTQGTLLPKKPPGELFARFTPEEKLPEDAAMRAFAIAKSLDSEPGIRKAPLFTVFRLYCMEGLSVEQIAKKLHCSKATIINRLRLLRKRTGTDPENLRAYSAQFSRIEDSLSDSRAKRIHRPSAIDDSPPEEEV